MEEKNTAAKDCTLYFVHLQDWTDERLGTGCPKKHGYSVTNSISSLLWISIVIPNFKSLNIIMSARVYFMKRVKDCKDVSIMSPQDEQWRRTSLLYSRYHYTKSKNYLKRRYRIRHWIPMFIGTPCTRWNV